MVDDNRGDFTPSAAPRGPIDEDRETSDRRGDIAPRTVDEGRSDTVVETDRSEGNTVTEVPDVNLSQRNVGPASDPNAPAVDPDTPKVSFTNEHAAYLDQAMATPNTDTDYANDYPDWRVWQTDDRFGRWHAAHVDNVGYYQGSSEDGLKDYLDNYGKKA